jgi:hypothetical protein
MYCYLDSLFQQWRIGIRSGSSEQSQNLGAVIVLFKFFFKVFVEILEHGVAHWDGQTSFILFLLEFQES